MIAVASEQVAAWKDHVERLSLRFREDAGIERDDLVQEGLISVWLALGRGTEPSEEVILARMVDWSRRMYRQTRGQATDPYVLDSFVDEPDPELG